VLIFGKEADCACEILHISKSNLRFFNKYVLDKYFLLKDLNEIILNRDQNYIMLLITPTRDSREADNSLMTFCEAGLMLCCEDFDRQYF